ncbi:protein of unknown function [Denitratisoma oestradiolicum]|uniref:Uncharacterized protein n=1 Tax=Denitratisoma oestradiolicum TaxID=311182 RepID=A0A6S6XZP0_9PROT|nr:protein of unknown function [Denitratisoma oestradiolicum]
MEDLRLASHELLKMQHTVTQVNDPGRKSLT